MKILISLFIGFIVLQTSCQRKELSSKEALYEYLADSSNGLVKERDLGAIKVKIKYLPKEYIIYNELKTKKDYTRKDIDSLTKIYGQMEIFLMTIDFKKETTSSNALMNGLASYEEYKERIEKLNFTLDEYVMMNEDSPEEQRLLLWSLENTYTVGTKRNITLVFAKDSSKKAEEYNLSFKDDIFYSGISHYRFNKKDIKNLPEITLLDKAL